MARSARPEILADWEDCLRRHNCAADVAHAIALELEQIAAGKGVSIDRLRPADDPAADWSDTDRTAATAPDLTGVRERIAAARRRFETADTAAMRDEATP
jgi:hypothetical protein